MASSDSAKLAGIRVLPDVGVDHRADRDVPELDGAGVEELMRNVRSAGRTADEVAFPHGVLGCAKAQCSGAIEHEEHLLVGVVIVKRKRALAWRHRGHVVAQLARAELRCDRGELRVEPFAVAQIATELELIHIDDGRAHGGHSSSVQ